MNLLHYGLQRSGTNFLEFLFKKNYQVHFLNSDKDRRSPLQKHCRFYKNKELIPEPQYCNEIIVDELEQFESLFKVEPDYYLIISKDPYSWYLSYRTWADKCNWPKVTHHYIEEYNQFYKTFMEFSSQSDKFLFIRYTDLIEDTGAVLSSLENRMELKRKLLSRLKLKKPGKVSQSSAFSETKRTYYLNQEYLKKYSADDLRIVNELLDPQVISFLGYEPLGLVN